MDDEKERREKVKKVYQEVSSLIIRKNYSSYEVALICYGSLSELFLTQSKEKFIEYADKIISKINMLKEIKGKENG
jgi:hypothetical protein